VTGTLLYYARAVDQTILLALNAIATQQAAPTQDTLEEVKQVLDYCASQEEAVITYHASNVILAIHSNAGYLNKQNQEVGQTDTSISQVICHIPPTMGQYLTLQKSSTQ
jgi:hypothetical protein